VDLDAIAERAQAFAQPGEQVSGVLAAEPAAGARVYLCAFEGESRTWLAVDETGQPVTDRALVRDAVSIAALCEIAEETAGGGDLAELKARLRELELADAQAAAEALERAIAEPPRVATPAYLDEIGSATRQLEQFLGDGPGSPFAEAMKQAIGAVEELQREVEGCYKPGFELR
jgi:hypothetical protein